jgi:4-amino-4-deoxy-L-arabinose transferase-like glycosyltransferase
MRAPIDPGRRTAILLGTAIVAAALLLRTIGLASVPPGLYHDEAMNGFDAVNALDGGFRIFYPANFGREGLFINIEALVMAATGPGIVPLRLPSALIGALSVAGLYWFARTGGLGRTGSFAATAALTLLGWHLGFSRIAYRGIFVPFFIVWCGIALFYGLRRRSYPAFFLAGLGLGLGFHTYIAWRIAPLLFFGYLGARFVRDREDRRFLGRAGALMAAAAAVAAAPIAVYFLAHPDDLFARLGAAPPSRSSPERPRTWSGTSSASSGTATRTRATTCSVRRSCR